MNYTWDAGLSFELDNIIESSKEEKESFAKLSKQNPELLPEIIKKAYQVWMSEPNIKLSKLKKKGMHQNFFNFKMK
jgi:hypothetical protein